MPVKFCICIHMTPKKALHYHTKKCNTVSKINIDQYMKDYVDIMNIVL